MDPAAEAKMLIFRPVRVKHIGVRNVVGVATAGGQNQHDRRTPGDGRSRDVNVIEGNPASEEMHRRFVAQQFLDNPGGQFRLPAQALQDFGVTQQGKHAVGDDVDGRLVAGDQQQRHVGH